jgi:hypothetical protein
MNRLFDSKTLFVLLGMTVLMLLSLIPGATSGSYSDPETSGNNMIRTINNWYDLAWHYRRPITIDHTKVYNVFNPSSEYAEYPLLVYATGLSNIKANGADIRFTSSNGTTELPREIESYSGGTLWAWVKVTLTKDSSDSSNDVIYMYYGNATATEPAANSTYGSQNVWDADYKLVTHMSDVTTSSVADSTSNSNTCTKRGISEPAVTTSGKIVNAQTFDGTNDRIDCGSAAAVDNIFATPGGTMEFWIYPTGWGESYYGRFADKGVSSGWRFYVNDNEVTAGASLYHDATSDGQWNTTANSVTLNQWNHVVLVFDKSSIYNNPTIYINSVAITLTEYYNSSGSFLTDDAEDLNIGNRPAEDRTFDGRIDECRFSHVMRSAAWIKTEYNNQNLPATFCNAGTEE